MERAVLVSVDIGKRGGWELSERSAELDELVQSAGLECAAKLECRRPEPSAALFIGKGKAAEIGMLSKRSGAQVIIFDHALSPAQTMNLEPIVGVKVIDRTQLILDIFAQRARSSEGKIQVELAQLEYLLPRMIGKGVLLSRLGGGIGTRGPGEQKLEVDRRRARDRIAHLKRELEKVRRSRAVMRARRQRNQVPVVSLVGYTNAGKSTLLNRLTRSHVGVRDKLFVTLDPTTRRLRLPGAKNALLTDTVGFLHDLPPQLIAAFKATLEELDEADLLIQVLDASHALNAKQAQAVEKVLMDLGLDSKPMILALNKIDRIKDPEVLDATASRFSRYGAVFPVSALMGRGLEELVKGVGARL